MAIESAGGKEYHDYVAEAVGKLGGTATHITMNPIAVNMQCHSARRARAAFTPAGLSYGF